MNLEQPALTWPLRPRKRWGRSDLLQGLTNCERRAEHAVRIKVRPEVWLMARHSSAALSDQSAERTDALDPGLPMPPATLPAPGHDRNVPDEPQGYAQGCGQ